MIEVPTHKETGQGFPWWELTGRIAGMAILAIFIPLVSNLTLDQNIAPIDQFFLGVLVFFSANLIGVTIDISRLRAEHEENRELELVQNEFEEKLHNIGEAYQMLLHHRRVDPDVYTKYFERVLSDVEEDIKRAAERRELKADERHIEAADIMINSLQGRDDDILRLVCLLDHIDFMYSTFHQTFFRWFIDLHDEGTIKEVRRLFVYKNEAQKELPQSQKMFDFHHRQPGYDYRVIEADDFERFCDDLGINDAYWDFGIYGKWYVYTTISAELGGEAKGVYHGSKDTVESYIQLFDNCWEYANDLGSITGKSDPMPLNELFDGSIEGERNEGPVNVKGEVDAPTKSELE